MKPTKNSEHRILVAPASFKGSLSAREAAVCMAEGVARRIPEASCRLLPLADGGEGTMEVLLGSEQALHEVEVEGPRGELIHGKWGLIPETRTAVIESAQALALSFVPSDERNPMLASSYGLGQMIRSALQAGADELVIGLGGVATSDGGLGMLQALGAVVKRENGEISPRGGAALLDVAEVDFAPARSLLHGVPMRILTDVSVPLLGDMGAAMFMEQKGAGPQEISRLLGGLNRLMKVVQSADSALGDGAGYGAAGGLGAALAWIGGDLVSGAQFVADQINLREHAQWATIILTGEGAMDRQTLEGKALMPLAGLAQELGRPLIGLCGVKTGEFSKEGFTSVFSVGCGGETIGEMMQDARHLLSSAAFEISGVFPFLGSSRDLAKGAGTNQ